MARFGTDNGDALIGKGASRFEKKDRTSEEVKQQTRPLQEEFDWEEFWNEQRVEKS